MRVRQKVPLLHAALLLVTVAYTSPTQIHQDQADVIVPEDFLVEIETAESSPDEVTDQSGGLSEAMECEATSSEGSRWNGVLDFVNNSAYGDFSCEAVWEQTMENSALWLRGWFANENASEYAVHITISPRDVKTYNDHNVTSYGRGAGDVTYSEVTQDFNGTQYLETDEQLLNHKFHYVKVVSLADDALIVNDNEESVVPTEVKLWHPNSDSTQGSGLTDDEDLVQTLTRRGLGYIEPSDLELADLAWAPEPTPEMVQAMPSNYSFTVAYPNASANAIEDQGECGSSWAFAAAKIYSQSLYQLTDGQYNIKLSQQNLLSCSAETTSVKSTKNSRGFQEITGYESGNFTDGCDGGSALTALGPMLSESRVTEYCSPYSGVERQLFDSPDMCFARESGCEQGANTSDLNYTVSNLYRVQVNENYIKYAIQEYGPVQISVDWFDSAEAYVGGVYAVNNGTSNGGHSMVIVGWGEEKGTDEWLTIKYWIVSNSHGVNYGFEGYMKWAIDSATAPIKTAYAVVPSYPSQCAKQDTCNNGGEYQSDCQCRCPVSFSGDYCDTCSLECPDGEVQDDCTCLCNAGFYGPNCEHSIQAYWTDVDPDANTGKVTIKWNLDTIHPGNNTIYRYSSPFALAGYQTSDHANTSFQCEGCEALANIDSRNGSTTAVLDFTENFQDRPKGESCYTAHMSLGFNDFQEFRGYTRVELPCFKFAENYKWGTQLDGTDGNCICGGTEPPEDNSMWDYMCHFDQYVDNCCPDDTTECAGRPGIDEPKYEHLSTAPTNVPSTLPVTSQPTTAAPTTVPTPEPTTDCFDVQINGAEWHDADGLEYDCGWYSADGGVGCKAGDEYEYANYTANQACCACGGGASTAAPTTEAPTTPSPTPAPTTEAPTLSPTTEAPTLAPTTNFPTSAPTTPSPSVAPTTPVPTLAPSNQPTTGAPTSGAPTNAPTTPAPTQPLPTSSPTREPTTAVPTTAPTSCADYVLPDGEWHDSLSERYDCEWYAQTDHCENFGDRYINTYTANDACCACGGGENTSPEPTLSSAPTNAPTSINDNTSSEPTNAPTSSAPTNAPTPTGPTNAPTTNPTSLFWSTQPSWGPEQR